ncbi:hypothetical protein SDC9_158340 [bioreactor metagenome]|uniref:Uncharacterized protein n=1 Tax=bioreactor metagenome TaxID=1076179 RepID=A0A645FCH1_9ZZZZ
MDQLTVWIEISEEAVGYFRLPGIVLQFFPVFNQFRAFYFHLFAQSSLINDTFRIRISSTRRDNLLAVSPGVHGYHVARHGYVGHRPNGFKRLGN